MCAHVKEEFFTTDSDGDHTNKDIQGWNFCGLKSQVELTKDDLTELLERKRELKQAIASGGVYEFPLVSFHNACSISDFKNPDNSPETLRTSICIVERTVKLRSYLVIHGETRSVHKRVVSGKVWLSLEALQKLIECAQEIINIMDIAPKDLSTDIVCDRMRTLLAQFVLNNMRGSYGRVEAEDVRTFCEKFRNSYMREKGKIHSRGIASSVVRCVYLTLRGTGKPLPQYDMYSLFNQISSFDYLILDAMIESLTARENVNGYTLVRKGSYWKDRASDCYRGDGVI